MVQVIIVNTIPLPLMIKLTIDNNVFAILVKVVGENMAKKKYVPLVALALVLWPITLLVIGAWIMYQFYHKAKGSD